MLSQVNSVCEVLIVTVRYRKYKGADVVEGQASVSTTSGPKDATWWMTDVFRDLYAVCAKTNCLRRESNK